MLLSITESCDLSERRTMHNFHQDITVRTGASLCPSTVYMVMGHQSQTLLQSSNENCMANQVWHLMRVISLTTLLMLTGQCRYMTLSKLHPMFKFWVHILGRSRERLLRMGQQRNLPLKANLTGVPGNLIS
jgi:hypothetical protein